MKGYTVKLFSDKNIFCIIQIIETDLVKCVFTMPILGVINFSKKQHEIAANFVQDIDHFVLRCQLKEFNDMEDYI
jgi:hypothetical protein